MKEFIKLNKWKLKSAFGITSIIFTTLVSGILIHSYYKGQFPDVSLLIILLVVSTIGMPLFVICVGTIRGTWDLNKRRNAFSKKPFDELTNYGFVEYLRHETSKWKFSEPMLVGAVGNYQIRAEVDTQYAPHVIRFQALVKSGIIGRNQIKRLNHEFKYEDIELDYAGVTKKISIRDERIATITQLQMELNRFIRIIEKEDFKP